MIRFAIRAFFIVFGPLLASALLTALLLAALRAAGLTEGAIWHKL